MGRGEPKQFGELGAGSKHTAPPLCYNTFLDEDLNRLLRDVAAYAHRLTFDKRVFSLLDLQSRLEVNAHMSNSGDWIALIAGI